MVDVDEMVLRPIARLLLAIARALLWLGWDLCVETVGWYVGWPIWRLLSFGRFPEADLGEQDQAKWWQALLVEFTGLAALVMAIWQLTRYLS